MKRPITLLIFVCCIFAVKAQSGDISGRVKDPNSFGVKLVNVVLVDTAGNPIGRGTQTNNYGDYSISPLAPGKYNLKYSAKGYYTQRIMGIVVNADKSTFVDARMKIDPNAPVGKKKKK